MILVDTSLWIDHLRKGDAELASLLNEGAVLCHPFVIGELACGNLRNRENILSLLGALPMSTLASHEEVLRLVSDRKLHDKGLGMDRYAPSCVGASLQQRALDEGQEPFRGCTRAQDGRMTPNEI